MNTLQDIMPYGKFGKSRAINAENPTGEKGKGQPGRREKEGWLPAVWEEAEKVVHA